MRGRGPRLPDATEDLFHAGSSHCGQQELEFRVAVPGRVRVVCFAGHGTAELPDLDHHDSRVDVVVGGSGRMGQMLIVRATRKVLDRVGGPSLPEGACSTTVLGDWYATVLFWRPRAALLVNASTLLPVMMPLAPAGTLT